MDILLRLPFCVIVSFFSNAPQYLLKQMTVAQTKPALPLIYTRRKSQPSLVAIGNTKERKCKAASRKTTIPVSNETVMVAHNKILTNLATQI